MTARPSPASPKDVEAIRSFISWVKARVAKGTAWEEAIDAEWILTLENGPQPAPASPAPQGADKRKEIRDLVCEAMADFIGVETAVSLIIDLFQPTPSTPGAAQAPAPSLDRGTLDAMKKRIGFELEAITAQRQEICRAFLAKYGCEPDKLEQVIQHLPDGTVWFVRPIPEPTEGKEGGDHG